MGKKMKRRHETGVETTPEIRLGDSEILVTPKNQQKDKKRKKQNKVESNKNLMKAEITQEPESNTNLNKVGTTTEVSEIDSDDPKKLKKIIDELSDRVNEMTEIVQKLKKTSELLEKENGTPKKKVVQCFYESEDAFIQHQQTIYVEGFRCSPPRDEIKSALIKHFSPCGEVSRVSIPFHCQTGSPIGYAFINMMNDSDKALTLDGSYLDGLRLTVKMAIKKSEYYYSTNHKDCERCAIAYSRHLKKQISEKFYSRNRLSSSSEMIYVPVPDDYTRAR